MDRSGISIGLISMAFGANYAMGDDEIICDITQLNFSQALVAKV